MSTSADRRGVAEAQLFGALQRAISMWRTSDEQAMAEQRAEVLDRWANVESLGGDPAGLVGRVWAREVNYDLPGVVDQVDVFGELPPD